MVAVKNSMKRRLARSPWARMIVGSVSRPARMSAGGGMVWSVKIIGCLAIGPHPPRLLLYGIKVVMQYKKGNRGCPRLCHLRITGCGRYSSDSSFADFDPAE